MASIPGAQFNITGASGTTGLLGPKSAWRCFVFPRGGYASQDSVGTTITFDSAAIASRFAANDWVQVGLSTANIRQVAGVGGNSIAVSGAAVTVTENDRVLLIGSTQPTVTGGSSTYTIPRSFIYQRDDDTADRYTNSMVVTDNNGLVRFYSSSMLYDCLIQDGNQTNQGYIADLNVGAAEGISTSLPAFFGSTVTFSGWAVFGATVTMNAALGVTGTAAFGSTVTLHSTLGVTGIATFGTTAVLTGTSGNYNHSGTVKFGNSVTVTGAAGFTGPVTFGTTVTLSGSVSAIQGTSDVSARRFNINRASLIGSTYFVLSGWGATAAVTVFADSNDQVGSFQIGTGGTTYSPQPTIVQDVRDGGFIGTGQRLGVVNGSFRTTVAGTTLGPAFPISYSNGTWTVGVTPSHGQVYTFRYFVIGVSTI
jgi:hypothetical protein